MNPFLKCCLIGTVGILFCQLQSIAQLCTTRELGAREMKIIKFDTTSNAGLADNFYLWDVGQTIYVRFINGPENLQKQVMKIAREWEKFANIRFELTKAEASNIKIGFSSSKENFTLIGTEALQQEPGKLTMQLELLSPYDSFQLKRIVLHEFGHVLGLLHEHNNPADGINWEKDTLYRYYNQFGWNKEMVDNQVLGLYNIHYANGIFYDPKSIMHFPIAAWQTKDGYYKDWNTVISEGDKQIIGMLYPFDGIAGEVQPKVTVSNYSTLRIATDTIIKGIRFWPSFRINTAFASCNVAFAVMFYNSDGNPIWSNNEKYNVCNLSGSYREFCLAPNKKLSLNENNRDDFQLIMPFSHLPRVPDNTEILVVFNAFQKDRTGWHSIFRSNPFSFHLKK